MSNNSYCLDLYAQSAVKVVGIALYTIDVSVCAWAGRTSSTQNRDPQQGC